MKDKRSELVRGIPVSGIRAFFELVLGVPDVLSLGVGEPDFVTPWRFREASIFTIEKGYTRYTSNWGLIELRQAISRYTGKIGGPVYSPKNEILITVGVSEGMDITLRSILDPGDEVILPDPCFVSYEPLVRLAGGKPVFVPTKCEEGFRLIPSRVEAAITGRTKAVFINYPNNPTGATIRGKDLEEISEIVKGHDLILISDEIYDRLTYSGEHIPASSIPGMKERTIYLNGFSKGYAMTGWRIGYAAGPPDIIEAMMKVHQYSMMCAPIMGQMAALEALRSGWSAMERMVASYRRRRRLIVDGLEKIGLDCHEPEGAFYAFPSIRKTGLDSMEFCRRLLEEEKVAVVPGSAFGAGGEGHVRMAYAASVEVIKEALERIGRFVSRIR